MKFSGTRTMAIALLVLAMAGCQKNDNFLIKMEAFSVVTSGYNGSDSALDITIDTSKLKYRIEPSGSFKRTDKYTFNEGQDSVKLVITDRKDKNVVYETIVKRGEYTVAIDLIYVNGKVIKKPVMPESNPAGFRLYSYLFMPRVSGYTGKVDIVYFKKFETVVNGQFVVEKKEELTRLTVTPWEFSDLFRAPAFPGGRQEIEGKVYFVNPLIIYFKSGTNIPYHEDAGVTLSPYASIPLSFNSKPEILGVLEKWVPGSGYVDSYESIKF